jgi:hypothetical protein
VIISIGPPSSDCVQHRGKTITSLHPIVIPSSRRDLAAIRMPGIRVVTFCVLLHLFAAATPLVARSDPETAAIAFDADPDGAGGSHGASVPSSGIVGRGWRW